LGWGGRGKSKWVEKETDKNFCYCFCKAMT
jgi:hypothetical protein